MPPKFVTRVRFFENALAMRFQLSVDCPVVPVDADSRVLVVVVAKVNPTAKFLRRFSASDPVVNMMSFQMPRVVANETFVIVR